MNNAKVEQKNGTGYGLMVILFLFGSLVTTATCWYLIGPVTAILNIPLFLLVNIQLASIAVFTLATRHGSLCERLCAMTESCRDFYSALLVQFLDDCHESYRIMEEHEVAVKNPLTITMTICLQSLLCTFFLLIALMFFMNGGSLHMRLAYATLYLFDLFVIIVKPFTDYIVLWLYLEYLLALRAVDNALVPAPIHVGKPTHGELLSSLYLLGNYSSRVI